MRESRGNTPLKPSPTHPIPAPPSLAVRESGTTQPGHDSRILDVFTRIADALDRLSEGIEQQNNRLGDDEGTRYTSPPEPSRLVDEKTMAEILTIPRRTLAYHRDQGRLPGCWVKNGRRILWHVEATREAWKKGIA